MPRVVRVHDKLALEQTGLIIELGHSDIRRVAQNKVGSREEKEYYGRLRDRLAEVEHHENNLRRIVIVDPPDPVKVNCVSLIQVIDGTVIAHMRSADTRKLPSDLGFFCRLAVDRCLSRVMVSVGSLHTHVEDGL
jgi:hypothetical protein